MNKISLALLVLASAAAGAALSGYAGMRPIASAEAAPSIPQPATMVVVDQAPAFDGEKVIVMRDTKRNVTCWLFSSGSSSCMPDQWIEPYAKAEANQ